MRRLIAFWCAVACAQEKHGHAFTAEDWTALMDFADKHLLGRAAAASSVVER